MVATTAGHRLEAIARDLFEVITQVELSGLPNRRRLGDLKEIEYLTLSILSSHGTMIVGDIQRLLGVLPAQMSRIIRSLEARERPFIACHINPQDKRKIDVCLTAAGDKALVEYREYRVRAIADLLRKLPEEDLDDVQGLLEKLQLLPDRTVSAS